MATAAFFNNPFYFKAPVSCTIDSTPPTFAGIAAATFQPDGSALISWLAGTSTKTPVRYEIYAGLGTLSAASLFVTANRVTIAPSALTSWRVFVLRDQVTFFMPGQAYTFGVRAVDSQNYSDSNTVVTTQTATYVNYGTLAASVWDVPQASHVTAGTFGKFLDAQVSLTQTAATALTQYNALTTAVGLLQTAATALTQYNALTTAIGLVQTAATALTQYNALVTAIGSPQQAATALTQYNNIQTAIGLVQTAATALSQFNTLVADVTAIPTNPLLTTDSRLNHLDVDISTRLATSGYTAPDNADIVAIKAKTDNLPADPASNTQVNTRLPTSSYVAPDNADIAAIKVKTDNLPADPASNTQVNTRLAASSYVAPDNTDILAIKAKTDNLPASPANEVTLAAVKAKTDNLPADPASNTQVNTRASDAHLTSVDNDVVAVGNLVVGVKAKTDQLLFDVDTGVKAHTLNTTNVNVQQIVDGVWNEPTSAHTGAGTFGENAQTPAINPQQVADAVWNEPLSPNHLAPNTAGKALHDGGSGGGGGGSGFGIAEAIALQPAIVAVDAVQPQVVEAIALENLD